MTKKALIVGVDIYQNPNWNLKGCTMDAAVMSGMLQDHFGFDVNDVRVLMNERATKANIVHRLGWLVQEAKPGDVLVFFFAGHGSQIRDRDGDELKDDMDEILCPHDLNWDDPLTDDILHSYFKQVPQGVNLTVVFDCCHSGTGTRSLWVPVSPEGEIEGEPEYKKVRYIKPPLDIEHRSRGLRPTQRLRMGEESVRAMNHILLAACEDFQEAQETVCDGQVRGAFSFHLAATFKRANWELSNLEAKKDVAIRLRDNGFAQIPQLECPDQYLDNQIFDPIV